MTVCNSVLTVRRRLGGIVYALLLLSFGAVSNAAAQTPTQDQAVLDVRFKDIPVKDVLVNLGKSINLNVTFDESVRDSKLDLELHDVTLKAVMKIIFVQHKLQARLIEEKTIIVFADNAPNRQRFQEFKVWPEETKPGR